MAAQLQGCSEMSLGTYAASLWRAGGAPASQQGKLARKLLMAELSVELGERFGVEEARAALAQFSSTPLFQTSDHCQLILDPTTFYTNLVYRLGAVRSRRKYLFVNACSTVTLESKGKSGPGWLATDASAINVLGWRRRDLSRTSVCAAAQAVRFELTDEARDCDFGSRRTTALNDLRATLRGAPEQLGRAFCWANETIWSELETRDRTKLVYTDDFFVAKVVARHIAEADSLVHWLVFQVEARALLREELELLGSGFRGRALRQSTAFFWLAREGRIRALAVDARGFFEPSAPGDIVVPLNCECLVEALRTGLLYPNLLIGFLALSVLPQVQVLGGSSQEIYMSTIEEITDRLLRAFADLQADRAGGLSDWITATIETEVSPFRALSDLGPADLLDRVSNEWEGVALGKSVGDLDVFSYLVQWNEAQ